MLSDGLTSSAPFLPAGFFSFRLHPCVLFPAPLSALFLKILEGAGPPQARSQGCGHARSREIKEGGDVTLCVEGSKGRSPQRMEGACVLRRRCKGLGVGEGRGGSGQEGRRTRIGPPAPRLLLEFPRSYTAFPEVQPPSRRPAATHCGRPRPLSAPPPASPPPPPAGGGDGLQRRWWRFRYPKSGARSRSRGRRPGYDRGSLASRSGQPESSSRLLPVPEQSPQPGPTARFAAAPPARPL